MDRWKWTNKTFDFDRKIEIVEKIRQSAENKQTFDLTGKLKWREKNRQIAEN